MNDDMSDIDGPIKLFVEAIIRRDRSLLEALLRSGLAVDTRGPHGETPLMWAVDEGWFDGIDFLLAAGADPAIESDNATTPLIIASDRVCGLSSIAYGPLQWKIIDRLVAAGARMDTETSAGETASTHHSEDIRRLWEAPSR